MMIAEKYLSLHFQTKETDMDNKVNMKWVVDTCLEGFMTILPLLIVLPIFAESIRSGEMEFKTSISDFIAYVCFGFIISFGVAYKIANKKFDDYGTVVSIISTAIFGVITRLIIQDHYSYSCDLEFSGLAYMAITTIVLWLISQYKRFDFVKEKNNENIQEGISKNEDN